MSDRLSIYLSEEREERLLPLVGGDRSKLSAYMIELAERELGTDRERKKERERRFDTGMNWAMFIIGISFFLSFLGSTFLSPLWSFVYDITFMIGGFLLIGASIGKLRNGKVKKNGNINTVNNA